MSIHQNGVRKVRTVARSVGSVRRDSGLAAAAERFGAVPNFFRTAHSVPGLIDSIYAFAEAAYLDCPLPSVFKERLFVQLSRFCEARYCVVHHAGSLLGYGRPAAGPDAPTHTVEEVTELLTRPVPSVVALSATLKRLSSVPRPLPIPPPGSSEERDLFDALTAMFVAPRRSTGARNAVMVAVGEPAFELLAALLAFVRVSHFWTETHPDIESEPGAVAFLAENPVLAILLLDPTDADRVRAGERARAVLAELRRAEDALRAGENERLVLLDAGHMAAWQCDTENGALHWGDAFVEMLGLDGESRTASLDELLAVVSVAAGLSVAENFAKIKTPGRRIDIEFQLTAGKKAGRWIKLFGRTPTTQAASLQGVAFDVTGRRTMESALRDAAALSQMLSDRVIQSTWEADPSGTGIAGSASWSTLTGEPLDSADCDWLRAVHPDDRDGAMQRWREAVGAGTIFNAEFRLRSVAHAGYRWTSILAGPVRDARGAISKWIGVNVDVDDRKRAEAWLRTGTGRVAGELADVEALQRISTELVTEQPQEELYERILDAAMILMKSDAASLHLLDENGLLNPLASRNLAPESTPRPALTSQRTYLEDTESAGLSAQEREEYRRSSLRAMQSTPLVSRSGEALGLISTQWREPQTFDGSDFRQFDVLARLVADLISRLKTDAAIRASEELQASLLELSDALSPLDDPRAIVAEANRILRLRIDPSRPVRLQLFGKKRSHRSSTEQACAVVSSSVWRPASEKVLIDAVADRASLALKRTYAETALRENETQARKRLERDALGRRLLLAEEEQRGRFARELHDEAGQHITALRLGLQALSAVVEVDSVAGRKAAELQALAGALGAELHGLAYRLRPKALDDFGLRSALRSYVEQWSANAGIEAGIHVPGSDERMSPMVEAAVYRIVQEALTNVAVHSGAKRAGVILERKGDEIRLIVEDDGKGFNVAATARGASRGLGLLGIRERVDLLRGAYEIESTLGRGTTLLIRFPAELDEENTEDL